MFKYWVSVCGFDLFAFFTLSGADSGCDSGNSGHSVLALLHFSDCDVAGVDGDLVGSTVSLIFGHFVDVDSPLLSVHLDYFSLVSFLCSSQHDNFVVFSDGKGTNAVLGPEGFGKGG